jgi:hypothetical protein
MQRRLKERTSFEIEVHGGDDNYAIREGTTNKAESIKRNRFIFEMLIRYSIHYRRSYSVMGQPNKDTSRNQM